MLTDYTLDNTALQPDPNLTGMTFSAGSHGGAFSSETGQEIYRLLTSRFGVAVLIGAIVSAPSRPPVIATEPWVHRMVGDAGFTDEMKQYTGKLVRVIVEHIGGRWLRKGQKVTVDSRYSSGSIYTFRALPEARPAA
ncbi:hypothetical protein ACOI1H_15550 [Loktanella sp. DJP18]|uniref:hypothetical protein n=1 Tax=Loktanella sp. DJP18 TaxID=3409788 RepID=UPI003BB726B5